MSKIYVATQTFATEVEGHGHVIVHSGITRVREGHPLLAANPDAFEVAEDRVDFDIEEASAAPGVKRGQAAKTAKTTG